MVSKIFILWEYLKSDTANKLDILEQYNPSLVVRQNLEKLHINVILPLLNYLPGNLIITSGYRCKRLNDAVGGVANSDHLQGYAVDLNYFLNEVKNDDILWAAIKILQLKFRQLGNEHNKAWIHISYNEKDLKMEVFNA
jgi:hypothetical protein